MSQVIIRNLYPAGLHGFGAGQLSLDDLGPGLNLVFAPNASGKSTLGRAVGLLFSPVQCGPDTTILAEVQVDDETRHVTARHRGAAFDGFPGRPEHYGLDLVRLLEGLRDKSDLAFLHTLIGSGLDLKPPPFPNLRRVDEARIAIAAYTDLETARITKASVSTVEEDLPRLTEQSRAARDAAGLAHELQRLQLSRTLRERRERADKNVQELLVGHPGIDRQSDNALSTARSLITALDNAQQASTNAAEALARVHPTGGMPSRPLQDVDRDELADAVSEYNSAAERGRAYSRLLAATSQSTLSARETLLRLLPEEAPDALPRPTAEDVESLRGAAQSEDILRAAHARAEGFRTAQEWWQRNYPEGDTDPAGQALVFRDWLAAEPLAGRDPRPVWLLGVGVAGALVIAFLPEPGPRLALAVIAVLSAGSLYFLLRPKASAGMRAELSARLPPGVISGSPTPLSVADALRDSLLQLGRAEARKALELQSQQSLPTSNWQTTAQTLRLKARDPYLLAPVTQAMLGYHEAVERAEQLSQDLRTAERETADASICIRAVLRRYEFAAADVAPPAAAAAFLSWFERAEQHRAALKTEAERLSEVHEYLDTQGLPTGADFRTRVEQLRAREPVAVAYREAARAAAELLAQVNGLQLDEDRLAVLFGSAPDAVTDADLSALLAAQKALAGSLPEYEEQLLAASSQVRTAEEGAAVSQKEQLFGEKLRAVEERYERLIHDAVRYRVRTSLNESLRKNDLPPVVERANALLQCFTGRYRLEHSLAEDGGLGLLSVYDERRGRTQRFEELSTGTRVHVILALRLGLVEEHERAANGGRLRFPLVADEVLAVSDPEASEALARVLLEVAKDRQVLLFTNQVDDVALMLRFDPTLRVRTLGAVLPPAGEALPKPAVPAYRQPSGPSRFDLTLPVRAHAPAAVLPAALLADEDENYCTMDELLRARNTLDPALLRFLEHLEVLRSELAHDYPRVTWDRVGQAEWVTSAFRDRIREATLSSAGCGVAFLEAVQALRGVQRTMVERSRAWLEESGCLIPVPELQELRRQVRRQVCNDLDAFQIEHLCSILACALRVG